MSAQRAAAVGAILFSLAGFVLAAAIAIQAFPRGLFALALVAVAAVGAWYGVVGRLPVRIVGFSVAFLALDAAILLMVGEHLLEEVLMIAAILLACALTRTAFGPRVRLPPMPAPSRAVLFFNPRSGGGKAERFSLAEEATARGIEPIELGHGDDLERLVRDAIADGGAAGALCGGGSGGE